MTIKVLEKVSGCFPLDLGQGEWFDLYTAEDVCLKAPEANKMHIRGKNNPKTQEVRTREVDFDSTLVSLGVAMQIPKGFEACVIPRSSTFKKHGILQSNSFGLIDSSYCGSNDIWKMPMIATRAVKIPKGTRIAQFRIQLSQKASLWQKLKWFFSSSVKLEPVYSLDNPDRQGFGSTGN